MQNRNSIIKTTRAPSLDGALVHKGFDFSNDFRRSYQIARGALFAVVLRGKKEDFGILCVLGKCGAEVLILTAADDDKFLWYATVCVQQILPLGENAQTALV